MVTNSPIDYNSKFHWKLFECTFNPVKCLLRKYKVRRIRVNKYLERELTSSANEIPVNIKK